MLIGELPRGELARRLCGAGIFLDTGAFTTHLRLHSARLVDEFADLYCHYSIDDLPRITDGHIRVAPSAPWRRFIRPKFQAYLNGSIPFEPHPARLAFPLLESTLNWCAAMSDTPHLILHAAVVERNDVAIVIPGPSGSGKSTLCAALTLRGWRLLSDEFAIIRSDDGRVVPNPRPVSLKNRSIDLVAGLSPDAHVGKSYEGTLKGTIAFLRPPADSVARVMETARPGLVISVRHRPRASLALDSMEKAQGFMWLADNAVNYLHLLQTGFETLAALVDACPIYRLTYSDLDAAIAPIEGLHRDLVHAGKAA